jgi:hypothetical protein
MKKHLFIFVIFLFLPGIASAEAWNYSAVRYIVNTDVLEILDKDIQGEFQYIIGRQSTFAFRLGYYRTLEGNEGNVYPDLKRHWELGARWRRHPFTPAPHFLFVGLGFDNRPQDNTVSPTGELGANLVLRPLTVTVLGFAAYEIHWKNSDDNWWVYGVELRVGFAF